MSAYSRRLGAMCVALLEGLAPKSASDDYGDICGHIPLTL